MPQKKQTPGETPRNTEVFPVSPSKRLKRSLLFTSKTHGISSSEENGVPPIAPIGDRVAQLLWKPDEGRRGLSRTTAAKMEFPEIPAISHTQTTWLVVYLPL